MLDLGLQSSVWRFLLNFYGRNLYYQCFVTVKGKAVTLPTNSYTQQLSKIIRQNPMTMAILPENLLYPLFWCLVLGTLHLLGAV